MLKNNLFNRSNNKQLIDVIASEEFERTTCSFYRYIKIKDLSNIRNQLYARFTEINILGRIYIAKEGINAQLSVPAYKWDEFVYNMDLQRKHLVYVLSKQQLHYCPLHWWKDKIRFRILLFPKPQHEQSGVQSLQLLNSE